MKRTVRVNQLSHGKQAQTKRPERQAGTPPDFAWGIIADDLTGACDTGAIFARKGFTTVVLLDRRSHPKPSARVTVLTTKSRSDSARLAETKVRQACRYLKARRIHLLYKKIDSTLQGHVPEEIEAMMRAAGFAQAIVCPAFPAQGRTVCEGILYVHGQPTADLSTLFVQRRRFRVASVHRPISAAKVAAAIRRGRPCMIADAETERDLAHVVDAATRSSVRLLLVGSAGMARHVADVLLDQEPGASLRAQRHAPCSSVGFVESTGSLLSVNHDREANAGRAKCPAVPNEGMDRLAGSTRTARPALRFTDGPFCPLVIAGSNNPITQHQIDVLVRCTDAHVDSLGARGGMGLKGLVAQGRLFVLRVPLHQLAHELLLRKLAALDSLLSRRVISSLVVVGGDTASLVVRWLQAKAIELLGEIAPGIPWGRFIGGKANGMTVCTKAGGFGGAETLVRAVEFLRAVR